MQGNELDARDRVILAITGLLSYFVLSGTLAPIGLLIEPLANLFELSPAGAARVLSGFTTGNLVGAFLALFLLGRLLYRSLAFSIYVGAAVALVLLAFVKQTTMIWLLLGFLGVNLGVGLALAAQLIALSYQKDQRAALLVATDSSFSLAGTLMATLTAYLLLNPISGLPIWLNSYLAIFCLVLLILALVATTKYPEAELTGANWSWMKRMPTSVWIVGIALYCYTLGQTSILLWLPSLIQLTTNDANLGAEVVGRYWFGMFLGQIFAIVLVLAIGRRRVLAIGAVGACSGALVVANVPIDRSVILWASLGWGFFNLGILKMLVSLATDCAKDLPDQLVPTLLLLATLGTACSPIVTSWLVEGFSQMTALMFGVGAMIFMLGLTIVAYRSSAVR